MNRRGFIRLLAGVGVAVASGNLLGRAVLFQDTLPKPVVTLTRPMMGTSVSISVLGFDRLSTSVAAETALAEMEQLEKTLSRYRSDSPLSKLNRDGRLREAPLELVNILGRARFFSDLSGGAFDVTVKPIVDLISRGFAMSQHPPSGSEIASVLQEVDYQGIEFVGSTIQLRQGMGVTLDGIAKGYIVDRAIEALKKQGYEHAYVGACGDIRTIGGNDQGKGWRIGIRDPLGRQDLIRIMQVTDRAVSTSGDYEIFFDRDKKYFHIVNPKNGRSPQEVHSVTIVAENAIDADAMATTVMVLGPQQGLNLVEKIEGAECFLVLRDGSTVESSGMRKFW